MFSTPKNKTFGDDNDNNNFITIADDVALYVTEVVKGVEAAYKYIEKEALDGQLGQRAADTA